MKIPHKTTKKLFKGTYKYKIVLVCAGAGYFRGNDMDSVLAQLNKIKTVNGLIESSSTPYYHPWRAGIKTQGDLDYAFKVQHTLSKLNDIEVRIENPWITVYSNKQSDIDLLSSLDQSKVKYICVPPENIVLTVDTVILPKVPYDYRITVGKTTQTHTAFVEWAEKNDKLKLTKSCKQAMLKSRSWGGTHFYVTGDKNLLLTRMHLGDAIAKVERILKTQ